MADTGRGLDFFVSHAGHDRAWAEWVAAALRTGGWTVELDVFDWAAGDDVLGRTSAALQRCAAMVALWSPAYFRGGSFSLRELVAADASGVRVIPLRVAPCDPPPLWRHLIYRDLFGSDAVKAHRVLSEAVTGAAGASRVIGFPGAPVQATARLPGSLPPVWNVPARSAAFTGRDDIMLSLRRQLAAGRPTVSALRGMSGVGKSQLAAEYAYRFAGDYELVWWINAEQPELIGDQLAALAIEAGLVESGVDTPGAVKALWSHLRARTGWLVVFDNASAAADLATWIPSGPGQVLVTSRAPGWADVAVALEVDVFARPESLALLASHLPALAPADADAVAAALGDLPLGLAQAAGVMAETGMPAAEYLLALSSGIETVLSAGVPVGYRASLVAATRVAAAQLTREDPAAGQLTRLCALLGSEPIPLWLITGAPDGALPEELAHLTSDTLALRQCVGRIGRFGLVRGGTEAITMHRLTRAVLAVSLSESERADGRRRVEAMLVSARPDDGDSPATWPQWSQLLPHILAAGPATSDNPDLRWLGSYAVFHLLARGEARTAVPLAAHQYQQWRERYGPDDTVVLAAANNLAIGLYLVGQVEESRELHDDSLARSRRVKGVDHVGTLMIASNLATSLQELGRTRQARRLHEDALARRRRLLGEDHVDTLRSVSNLASCLQELGQTKRARRLHQDNLRRRRQILGEDDPDTLSSANNLACALRASGHPEQARELFDDTLLRRRRVLGEDHPRTLASAFNLANTLDDLGELEQALELHEDTLIARRRVLGEDHRYTLRSANNLAHVLRRVGRVTEARELEQDTLARRRRALGDDHPDTMRSAGAWGMWLLAARWSAWWRWVGRQRR